VVWKLVFAILIGFILLAISAVTSNPERRPSLDWRSGAWVWPYVLGLGVISYFGSFGPADRLPIILLKGAKGDLPYGVDVLVMAVFSIAIYLLAIRFRLPDHCVEEYVGDLTADIG
jgi:hypothetical protein